MVSAVDDIKTIANVGTGTSPLLAEKVKSGNLGAKTGRRISPTTVSGYIDEMIRNYLLFEATGC